MKKMSTVNGETEREYSQKCIRKQVFLDDSELSARSERPKLTAKCERPHSRLRKKERKLMVNHTLHYQVKRQRAAYIFLEYCPRVSRLRTSPKQYLFPEYSALEYVDPGFDVPE